MTAEIAFVLGTCERFFPTCVTIESLIGNVSLPYDLIVFEYGMRQDEKEILKKYNAQIVRYDRNSNMKTCLTHVAFSKYECFKISQRYEKTIWIDSDCVVDGNLDRMIELQGDLVAHRNTPKSTDFSVITSWDEGRP